MTLTIHEAASTTGWSARMLRYVEDAGLVVPARTPAQFELANDLFRQYAAELDVDLCFQGFAEELKSLPGKYALPDGALLLAMEQTEAVGCVALRRFSATDAEMKRLYLRSSYRHLGVGRQLAESIIDRARNLGYRRMVLDTLATMQTAQALYRSLGFASIDAYYVNPLPGVIYFAKVLAR